ncbi:efflux RND transporter periplasmic adaptor subunit [Actinobacillus pleuropneumoniae]|uniref:efflux RND transporter periplasmic adaptor subunit n=1 Tax=Actinobacillus pleuropneumoniae TaxID=715 RepID=UPI003B025812
MVILKIKKYIKYTLFTFLLGISYLYFWGENENYQEIIFHVERGNIQKTVIASGTLQATEQVDIGAQVSGQIKHILVQEGQKVKKGELLAVIDPRLAETELKLAKAELANASANLDTKKINLKQLQSDWERHQRLIRTNATSQKETEEAKSRLNTAKAELQIAQNNLDIAKIRVEKAETELGYTEIRSPLDATVISVFAQNGQTLVTTQQVPVLMKLANIDTMKVNTKISEADVIHIQAGAPTSFTLLGESDSQFHGQLDMVKLAPVHITDTTENTNNAIYYYATFKVPNPDHRLRISMTAAVTIMLDKRENVLNIPLSALGEMIVPEQYYVTVLRKHGQKEQVVVRTGLKDGAKVEIIEGLVEGDKVLLPVSTTPASNDAEIYSIGL